jgi:hypothetical protein
MAHGLATNKKKRGLLIDDAVFYEQSESVDGRIKRLKAGLQDAVEEKERLDWASNGY